MSPDLFPPPVAEGARSPVAGARLLRGHGLHRSGLSQLCALFRAGAVGTSARAIVKGLHADLLEEAEPLAFVVLELNIKYLKPARIDDALVVRTLYEQVKGAWLIIRQSVERDGEVLCRAEVTAAQHPSGRSAPAAVEGADREGHAMAGGWGRERFLFRSSRRKPGPRPFASRVRRMTTCL